MSIAIRTSCTGVNIKIYLSYILLNTRVHVKIGDDVFLYKEHTSSQKVRY
jgi:hypothetical protein